MRTAAGVLLGAVLAVAQTRAPDYAIVNAKIVVSADKTIPSGTILVRNGLIDSVSEAAPPPEARVFDAKGLTVYPGLIDAASHYGFPAPSSRPTGTATVSFGPPTVPDDITSPWKYLRPEPAGVNADVLA